MSPEHTILVIDDDPALLRLVEYNLTQSGYGILTAKNGRQGLQHLFDHKPALIVLDVSMPEMDGWTTCTRIREVSDIPIIMLTAQAQDEDIVRGLDLGADDYLVKPFEVSVLLARIRANIRRANTERPVVREEVSYSDAYLTINFAERRVLRDGEPVKLTKTEYALLSELVSAAPRVATYRHLLEQVWGFEYIGDIEYLRVYIWHLRRKIEPDPQNPTYVVNEQGYGYRFEKQAD